MALFGRKKSEMLVGPTPARAQRSDLLRRVRWSLLAIVVVVLVVVGLRHDRRESELRAVQVEIEQIATAARFFRQDFGRCPLDVDELMHPPAGGHPYIVRPPRDPWGGSYVLQCPGRWDENAIDVASRGPDGQWLGGDDISTDL